MGDAGMAVMRQTQSGAAFLRLHARRARPHTGASVLFSGSPQMTSLFDAIGLVAAALTTFAFLPQVIQTWRSGSTAGLNLWMLLVLSTGIALWFVYGIGIGEMPVILANGATLVLVAVLLGLKLRDVLTGRGVVPGE
jgi:MtN3 and saliva related transmembrane protein